MIEKEETAPTAPAGMGRFQYGLWWSVKTTMFIHICVRNVPVGLHLDIVGKHDLSHLHHVIVSN